MTDSRIKQVIDKLSEHVIALTEITLVSEIIGISSSARTYGELAFNAGSVKRQTVGKVLYQDVLMMIIVNSDNLETIRKTLETLMTLYQENGDKLVELQSVKVHDIHTASVAYPTKSQGQNKPFGHIVYELTLRITS